MHQVHTAESSHQPFEKMAMHRHAKREIEDLRRKLKKLIERAARG
jgi:hypothetical protein